MSTLALRFVKGRETGAGLAGLFLHRLEDVMTAARTKGVISIYEVAYAILERNGAISIIKNEK
jgi:Protein of unknown function (DUF421)